MVLTVPFFKNHEEEMYRSILLVGLASAALIGCATGAASKVSKQELATYKQWACSKCATLKNETSHKACTMVCKKDGAY